MVATPPPVYWNHRVKGLEPSPPYSLRMNRKVIIPLTDYSLHGMLKIWHGTSSSPASSGLGGTPCPQMSKSKSAPRLNRCRSRGPTLPRPHADVISTSRHANMKELRGKVEDRHLRVLYAFDPRRAALLLLGGDKTGDPKWYNKSVPIADDLFDQHLNNSNGSGIGKQRR
jgi:hypothetical protein